METDPTLPDVVDQLLEAQLPEDVSGMSIFIFPDDSSAIRRITEHAGYTVETQFFVPRDIADRLMSMGVPIANLQDSRLPPR